MSSKQQWKIHFVKKVEVLGRYSSKVWKSVEYSTVFQKKSVPNFEASKVWKFLASAPTSTSILQNLEWEDGNSSG